MSEDTTASSGTPDEGAHAATPATPPAPEPTPAVPAVSADPVLAKLKEFGIDDTAATTLKEQLGITSVDEMNLLTEKDLVDAGIKPIPARKLLASLVPATPAADAAAISATFDLLPRVPDDGPWLESLRTGGVLKVDQSTVIAGVRAALAKRVGLFEVPKKLVAAMEQFAKSVDEPVDREYYKLRQQLTRRTYGDIFEALEGMDGNYVTDSRRQELFDRINDVLWPAMTSFYEQLGAWQQSWMQGATSMPMILATLAGTRGGAGLPPGMLQPPDTSGLRDQADAVNDALNKVFAGDGIQIATAVAYDATQIKKSLENSRLPQMIGAANRDQMLKQLGVAVSATYPRLEVNITQFVLSVLQLKDQPAGNEELQYLGALYVLGSQIAWGDLGVHGGNATLTGIGGRRNNRL